MNKQEKQEILVFANRAFRQFYANNPLFLSDVRYKPGKRTYRNLLSLNKFMKCYLHFGHNYVEKSAVIEYMGWTGPSSYVQHERVITNFGLSDTSWQDRDREVLLLSDDGKKIRDQYAAYCAAHSETDLSALEELPRFAVNYLVAQIKNTTSDNMTLWKNTIISALFMYSTLGYIPRYSKNSADIPHEEEQAFKDCLNYTKNGVLQDVTYTDQPVAMLKNLKLLDPKGKMTDLGYNLLKNMKLFDETDVSHSEYVGAFSEDISVATEILSDNVLMSKTEAPERRRRKSVVKTSRAIGRPLSRNFEKEAEISRKIGSLGERLALTYEREKLRALEIPDIEDKVFLTSEHSDYGNAYPCDLISIDVTTGEKIFIEVKTTKGGIDEAFYISKEELAFSDIHREHYRLYRVYNLMNHDSTPSFYETRGYVGDNFSLVSDRYIVTRDIVSDDE